MAPPQSSLHPAPAWLEIGRPSPDDAQDWTTWVSPLGPGGGDALYRSLVLAGGDIAVAVELHARRGASAPRTVHRGRCGLPGDPEQTAERVRLLLEAADRAAAKAMEVHRGSVVGAAAERTKSASHRAADDAPQHAKRDGGVSATRHKREDRTRERARPEAATAA